MLTKFREDIYEVLYAGDCRYCPVNSYRSVRCTQEKGGNSGKGKNKGNSHQEYKHEQPVERRRACRVSFWRSGPGNMVRDYYGGQARGGKCPPGSRQERQRLHAAVGQAKKWAMGRPLPRDVAYHDLPYDLVRRLPPTACRAPLRAGGSDVLMIAAERRWSWMRFRTSCGNSADLNLPPVTG